MYEIQDGNRTLKFEGQLLGFSSSWRPGSFRWIEFDLYRTLGGSYVLSRVGVSVVYHGASCPLVKRYGLTEIDTQDLAEEATPCPECLPNDLVPVVFPEKDRHWAMVTEDAGSVLEALYKYDDHGNRYLTKVAERLLLEAAKNDAAIDQAYRVEIIL